MDELFSCFSGAVESDGCWEEERLYILKNTNDAGIYATVLTDVTS